MAKFKCTVCGQTFEADSKPDKCPICGAPASVIEEVVEPGQAKPKKKGFDTNNNTYIIVYSAILVIVVAFLLAFVASALKPQQDANVKIDTMQHKLNALNIRGLDKAVVEQTYTSLLQNEVECGDVKAEVFNVDGATKYLVPVSGRGLWGGISGYIALDDDLNTIFGTDFQHESETAGLGALIAEQPFQESFRGKQIFAEGASEVTLSVVKKGKQGNLAPENYVDGITGATLTSNGVNEMLKSCLDKVKELMPATEPAVCDAQESANPCGMEHCDMEGCGSVEGCGKAECDQPGCKQTNPGCGEQPAACPEHAEGTECGQHKGDGQHCGKCKKHNNQ